MLELKPGVRVLGIRPELVLALHVAEGIWGVEGKPLVVTAVMDGQHTTGSAHYRGEAADLRSNTLAPGRVPAVIAALQTALGPDYFILYEGEGTPQAHIHLEYRAREAY